MRTHDGNGAFVIVDHDEEDAIQAKAPISNIYSAGFNSSLYTLSLRRNYRRGFVTDFGRIEGLPGALRDCRGATCTLPLNRVVSPLHGGCGALRRRPLGFWIRF